MTQRITNTAHVAALEKIPAAARRMGCSTSQTYREIKAGRLGPIIKIGIRASALSAAAVDAWIAEKIAAATQGGQSC
jgi:predicted DNA-binding transcriptional regulator AlpA